MRPVTQRDITQFARALQTQATASGETLLLIVDESCSFCPDPLYGVIEEQASECETANTVRRIVPGGRQPTE